MNNKNSFLIEDKEDVPLVMSYISSDRKVSDEAIRLAERKLYESPLESNELELLLSELITSRGYSELEKLLVFMYEKYAIRNISLDIFLGCVLHRNGVVNIELLINKAKSYPYQKIQMLPPLLTQLTDTLLHIHEDMVDGFGSIKESGEFTKKRDVILEGNTSQFIEEEVNY